MKGLKYTLLCVGVSIMLVLMVNIAGNYEYYANGNDWKFSVFFTLCVTFLSWLASWPTRQLINRVFRFNINPTVQLLLTMLLFAMQGTVVMVATMKAAVVIAHIEEPSLYSYINNTVYCILFTLIIGLLVTSQQFLISLKQVSAEKQKAENELMRSQYEALKNQVNPHSLFNSLNTLLVLIPDSPDLAVQFVEEMAKVLRYSLQNDDNKSVTVATELKVTESLLFLNKQRFDDKLAIEIKVDASVLQRQIVTHSLLMLAENAIKHNEVSSSRPLTIMIYNEADSYLVVKNTLQRRQQVPDSTNIGLANIRQRYELAGTTQLVVEETTDSFIVKLPLL
jgi:two-component system LytT family sensor kinase